jgi:hypothetical protein
MTPQNMRGEPLIRTQIQLRDDQSYRLRVLAAREGVSQAELIRRAVDRLLEGAPAHAQVRTRLDALAVAGAFDSGTPGVARDHDAELEAAYRNHGGRGHPDDT